MPAHIVRGSIRPRLAAHVIVGFAMPELACHIVVGLGMPAPPAVAWLRHHGARFARPARSGLATSSRGSLRPRLGFHVVVVLATPALSPPNTSSLGSLRLCCPAYMVVGVCISAWGRFVVVGPYVWSLGPCLVE